MYSLFYKEWIKTQRIIYLLYLIFIAVISYILLTTQQLIRTSGAVSVWENIIQKDLGLVDKIQYLPLLAGLLMALAQFTAEMQNKRLKLTLHLPVPETKIMGGMLYFGILNLLLLFLVTICSLYIALSINFAPEIVCANIMRALPWFTGGLTAYLLCAWICIEPVWKNRLLNSIPACGALAMYYWQAKSGAYNSFIPYLILLTIVSFSFPFYSTIRFKDGAQ